MTQTKSTGLFVVYFLIIIINSYWTSLSKILWFVSGKQTNIWPWKINDLQYTDKSRYFAATELVNYFIMQGRAQLGEKRGFIYAWAEFYLQPIVGWNCTWADHYLWAVICRSRGGLLVNENEENFASNDNNLQWTFTILLVVSFISFTFWYLGCHQYCVGFKDSGNIWFWRWEQREYKPLLDDHPWGSEKPHALIHNYVYE